MATVTSYTAERMKQIEDETVVDGEVVGDNLHLITREGVVIDAGNVRGAQGVPGPPVADGDKGDIAVSSGGTNWQINPGVVRNAELANVPATSFKGGVSAGTPVDLTPTQAASILPAPTATDKGMVPPLPPSTAANGYGVLRTSGAWDVPVPSFVSKAALDSNWSNAPNGAQAYIGSALYTRYNGKWYPPYVYCKARFGDTACGYGVNQYLAMISPTNVTDPNGVINVGASRVDVGDYGGYWQAHAQIRFGSHGSVSECAAWVQDQAANRYDQIQPIANAAKGQNYTHSSVFYVQPGGFFQYYAYNLNSAGAILVGFEFNAYWLGLP